MCDQVLCLCLNILAIGPDLHAEHHVPRDTIVAYKDDIILSPTATAYCPGSDFQYARIASQQDCEAALEDLSEAYVHTQRSDGESVEWTQGSAGAPH